MPYGANTVLLTWCNPQALANESEVSAAIDARSLYARPFPMDATLDAITDFFNKQAPVNCVRMRRHLTSRTFKGSVFVEFAAEADRDKVLGMSLEYAGAPLALQKKVDYCEGKKAARQARPGSTAKALPVS